MPPLVGKLRCCAGIPRLGMPSWLGTAGPKLKLSPQEPFRAFPPWQGGRLALRDRARRVLWHSKKSAFCRQSGLPKIALICAAANLLPVLQLSLLSVSLKSKQRYFLLILLCLATGILFPTPAIGSPVEYFINNMHVGEAVLQGDV